MEQIIERSGKVYKVTVEEHEGKVLNNAGFYNHMTGHKVSLYEKREDKKWYQNSEFELVYEYFFEKETWGIAFDGMIRKTFEYYENM